MTIELYFINTTWKMITKLSLVIELNIDLTLNKNSRREKGLTPGLAPYVMSPSFGKTLNYLLDLDAGKISRYPAELKLLGSLG